VSLSVAVPIFTAPAAILDGSYLIAVVGRYDVRVGVPEEDGLRDIATIYRHPSMEKECLRKMVCLRKMAQECQPMILNYDDAVSMSEVRLFVAVPNFKAPAAILNGSYLIAVVGWYDVRVEVPEEDGVRDIATIYRHPSKWKECLSKMVCLRQMAQ